MITDYTSPELVPIPNDTRIPNVDVSTVETFLEKQKKTSTNQQVLMAYPIDQRRNKGLPTMHCISLLFTITIFNEHLAKSC